MEDRSEESLELLREAATAFAPVAFATSFSAEDMVLTDLIDRHGIAVEAFTLDTGRLPEETYRLMQAVRERYRLPIAVLTPDRADLEPYLAAHGPNAIFDNRVLREECCDLRKVRPLRRALSGKRAWITGQRREQSVTRRDLDLRERDAEHGIEKFNPLALWSGDEVAAYLRRHDVPMSALYAQGYASIGCAPCTRPIDAGEDPRAGRWWWEDPEHRECGIHRRRRVS